MSGLFGSLNATVGALNAQSLALQTAGKNLANVNNPSYSRERVIFGDRGTVVTPNGAEGLGIEALGIEQLRDSLLDQQVTREAGLSASYTAEQSGYQRAQAALGQGVSSSNSASSTSSSTSGGLGAAIDDFFNSFQSFASSPTDSGERQALIQQSGLLTDRFQLTDQRLAQVQSDLTTQATSDISTANGLLTKIADLNSQIGRFEINAPGSAVDLRDQRQADIEQLSAKMGVTATEGSDGEVQLAAKDANGNDVVLVDHAQVIGTVALNGSTVTAGSPATALNMTSGSITGSLAARDGAVQSLRDNLNQLAKQLVTSVNAAYNPTGSTGDFFNATGTTAGTIAVASTVTATNLKASDGGAAGDNSVALAVAQVGSQTFSTTAGDSIDGTISGAYGNAVSQIGQALAGANSRVTDQASIEKVVRTQRDSVSGVSLDEEMANLMTYQRAFQASSHVFSMVDNLLDTVVNHLGAG